MKNADEYLPEVETEIVREIHDHEVMLSFRDDEHAYAFHDWWGMYGADAFIKWVREERHPEHRG